MFRTQQGIVGIARLVPQAATPTNWRGERVGRDPLAPHLGVPRADNTQTKIGVLPEGRRESLIEAAGCRWPSPVRTNDDQRRCRRRQVQRGGGIAPVVSDDD
jgi:hypothetical protein